MTLTAKSWSSGRKGDIMNINWTPAQALQCFSYLHCFGGDLMKHLFLQGRHWQSRRGSFFDATSQCQRTGQGDLPEFLFLPDDPAGPVPWEALWFLETPKVIFKVTGLQGFLSVTGLFNSSLTFLIYCLINPFFITCLRCLQVQPAEDAKVMGRGWNKQFFFYCSRHSSTFSYISFPLLWT